MAQDVQPRIRIPSQIKMGEVIEVKTLVTHEMESGHRRDSNGALVPRRIINKFEASIDGNVVFTAVWYPSVSANLTRTGALSSSRTVHTTVTGAAAPRVQTSGETVCATVPTVA